MKIASKSHKFQAMQIEGKKHKKPSSNFSLEDTFQKNNIETLELMPRTIEVADR